MCAVENVTERACSMMIKRPSPAKPPDGYTQTHTKDACMQDSETGCSTPTSSSSAWLANQSTLCKGLVVHIETTASKPACPTYITRLPESTSEDQIVMSNIYIPTGPCSVAFYLCVKPIGRQAMNSQPMNPTNEHQPSCMSASVRAFERNKMMQQSCGKTLQRRPVEASCAARYRRCKHRKEQQMPTTNALLSAGRYRPAARGGKRAATAVFDSVQ